MRHLDSVKELRHFVISHADPDFHSPAVNAAPSLSPDSEMKRAIDAIHSSLIYDFSEL